MDDVHDDGTWHNRESSGQQDNPWTRPYSLLNHAMERSRWRTVRIALCRHWTRNNRATMDVLHGEMEEDDAVA